SYNGISYMLMDAPPEKEDVRPFIAVANHLIAMGYSAPRIYSQDIRAGLLLLEDMGNDIYSALLRDDPAREEALYRLAIDWLIDVHSGNQNALTPPALSHYDE